MEMVIKDTKYTLSALKKYYVMNGNDDEINRWVELEVFYFMLSCRAILFPSVSSNSATANPYFGSVFLG